MTLDLGRIIRNFTSTTVLRLLTAGWSFSFFVLTARAWNRQTLGEFTTLLAFVVFLQQMPLLGLHVPLVRDMAQRPETVEELTINALLISLVVGAVLAIALGILGTTSYPANLHTGFWLAGAAMLPSAVTCVAETLLLTNERMSMLAAVNAGEAMFRSAAWLLLARAGYGATAAMVVVVIGRLLVVAVYYRTSGLAAALRFRRRSVTVIRRILSLCPTFLTIHLFTAGLNRLDFLLLSKLGTIAAVGLYAAPYKIYEAAMAMPNIVVAVLFPVLARFFGAEGSRFGMLTRQIVRFCLGLGLPCAVVLAMVSKPLMVALYGPSFESAATILACLAFVPPLAAVDYALALSLHASHQQNRDLGVWFTACATYAVLLVVLIPRFSALGAAIATLLTTVVQVTVRYGAARRWAGITGVAGVVVRPIIAAAVMAAILAGLLAARPTPRTGDYVVAVLAATVGYVVMLMLTRAVTRADVRFVVGALTPARQGAA